MVLRVYYYDLDDKLALGNAIKCNTLENLLNVSDVVTLHIDDNKANKNFIGEREIGQMKKGAMFINLSRGFVVDIESIGKCTKIW